MQWYNASPTQTFGSNGERGIDLGTANNTQLTIPLAGKVLKAGYYAGGGEVIVQAANNIIEYFFHLNDIAVKAGQQLVKGQVVGTSGGGVGDKYLDPAGNVATVTNQSQLAPYSTGYHTEYGLLSGSTLQDFYTAMNTGSNSINPAGFIQNLQASGLTAVQGVIPLSTTLPPSASDRGTLASQINAQLNTYFANQFTNSIEPLLNHGIAMVGFVIVGLVIAIFGVSLLMGNVAVPASPSGGMVLQKLGKVVKK